MFYWRSDKPKIYGHVFLGNATSHTGILHRFETSLAADDVVREFLIEGARQLSTDYAFVHALGDPSSWSSEDKEINSAGADTQLPPVPWALCYGKPYVELFGKDNLLSLPLEETREVSPDLVYCQLTGRLLDAIENKELIRERREAVYKQLGRDAFFDPANPERQGRGPEFPKPLVVRPQSK
jgi:hypothetical protein